MGILDSTTSTSTDNPIADLQANYLSGIYDAATDIYNKGGADYYPGSTVAALDPVRAQGLNAGIDAAQGAQTDLANNQTGLLNNVLSGNDAYTNQLAQQAAANTASTFGQAGTLGSSRNYQQANLAASNAVLGRQLDASQQVAQAQRNAYTPAQTLQNIGLQKQEQEQNIINADKERYDYKANLPYNHLANYQSIVTNPQASAYEQGTSTTQGKSLFDAALGIGTVIAGLGNQGGLITKPQYSGRSYGMLAEGGQVPPTVSQQDLLNEQQTLNQQQIASQTNAQQIPQQAQSISQRSTNAYTPIDTVSTKYANSDWTRPADGHAWAIIDGRYQLVPSSQGALPGGGNVNYAYTPDQISKPTAPVTETPVTGNTNDTTTTQTVTYDDNGVVAPYKGEDIYDAEGDDNFLTTAEIATRVRTISDVIGADYDPNTTILTLEQQDLVNNSLDARLAMEDIYHNNQVIYGSQTGNNITSATTGSLTNTGVKADVLAALSAVSPILGALLPDDFSEKTFGDNTKAQFDAQTAFYAKQAGAIENADGTYDISAWFNETPNESANISKDKDGNLYDKDGTFIGTAINGVVTVIKGVGDVLAKAADRLFGTQYLIDQHSTDVVHSQVKEDPLKAGNNVDVNGNPRPPIPPEVLAGEGNIYYNNVTGAWTYKDSGVPLGGEIISNTNATIKATEAEKAAADKLRAEEEAKYKESEAKKERERLAAIESARLAEEIRIAEAAAAAARKDKDSAGTQAIKDANRAQLQSNVEKQKQETGDKVHDGWGEAQGGYIQKHNQGGRVSKLPAWMTFKNKFGV